MQLNPELWMVLLPTVGWFTFALGGTQISDTIPGQKWIRRFIYPLVLGISAGLVGAWWQGLAVGAISCTVFHLGYGIRSKWPYRLAIFTGYGLISIAIGISFWNLATVLGVTSLFLLSNYKPLANIFVWKICEGFFGLLIGIQVSYLLAGQGLTWLL